jgi:hypothetical protein
MQTLRDTHRFGCDFLMPEYFADFKRKVQVLEQTTGVKKEDYQAWLMANNAADNMASRMRFLLFLDDAQR